MRNELAKILEFLHMAEKLKCEMRHSWLSDGRRESVAEHSWRLAVMAVMVAPQLDQEVDIEKCLKFAVLHDIAEAVTGDIPVFDCAGEDRRAAKMAAEEEAMRHLCGILPTRQAEELMAIWQEYEDQGCYEARFIKALDKLEVQIQHNEAELTSWEEHEKRMVFQPHWMRDFCQFDTALAQMAGLVAEDAERKLAEAGEDVALIRSESAA